MVYQGKVADGMIVLDGGVHLPEGAVVHVVPIPANSPGDASTDVYRLGDLAAPTGVPDLAANIDHYLYGHPKQDGNAR